MPTYQYRCADCGHDLEVVQKFSDAALTQCPNCGGNLRKVFNAVGVVFKGSGFYKTDSKTSNSMPKSSGSASTGESSTTSSAKDSASAPKDAPSKGSTSSGTSQDS